LTRRTRVGERARVGRGVAEGHTAGFRPTIGKEIARLVAEGVGGTCLDPAVVAEAQLSRLLRPGEVAIAIGPSVIGVGLTEPVARLVDLAWAVEGTRVIPKAGSAEVHHAGSLGIGDLEADIQIP
jgi:hypothetical protein